MNEHCPVEASNLNNPSQRFQEVSGLNFNNPCSTCEFFHFNDLPATIQTKRHAASARMRQLGFTPIDNFTFLHPPPTGTTAPTNIISPCRKSPSFVPYKGTYVPYNGTFGAPDQGQTLDV
jgi:hypothetical protein